MMDDVMMYDVSVRSQEYEYLVLLYDRTERSATLYWYCLLNKNMLLELREIPSSRIISYYNRPREGESSVT